MVENAIIPRRSDKKTTFKEITESFTVYPALKKKNGARKPKIMALIFFSVRWSFLKNSAKKIPVVNARTASFMWTVSDRNPRPIRITMINLVLNSIWLPAYLSKSISPHFGSLKRRSNSASENIRL